MHWRLLLALAGLTVAWSLPGQCDQPAPPRTSRTADNPAPMGLFGSVATFAPYAGVLGYANGNGNYTASALGGFTMDLFLATLDVEENNYDFGSVLYGIESGLLYSFVDDTSHAILAPIVFKANWQLGPRWFVEGTAGAEAIYREVNSTMDLGRSNASPQGDSIEFFPSMGVNIAWKAGPWAAVSLRADYIPTPAQDLFSAMLGAVFPVG